MAASTMASGSRRPHTVEHVELHGRQPEREQIAALLAAARAGHSRALVIRGEPGIGKTALLHHATAQAATMGMPTLRAAGLQSESELAFAGLYQFLRPLLGTVGSLPPPLAAAVGRAFGTIEGGQSDPFLLALAALTMLEQAAEPTGLLGVVDGAEWLDESSLRVLLAVARRLDAEGVVLLFATSEDDPRALDTADLPVLTLQPLSDEASVALLDARCGSRLTPAVRERLLPTAAGNPLALLELAGAADSGRFAASSAPLPIGEKVEHAYLGRVRELDEDAQLMLLICAADDSAQVRTVRHAAEHVGVDPDALDRLESARLVTVDGPAITFRHPLVRSAVYYSAVSRDRGRAHAALAAVLAGDADADRRAWHRAAAAEGPDAEIANDLERAAEVAARRGAHAAAASALERAAEFSESDGARGRRLLAAAEASRRAGSTACVYALLDRARGLLDRSGEASAALTRGSCMVEEGALAEAFRVLTSAARAIPRDDEPGQALALLFRAAEASWWAGRADWAAEVEELASTLTRVEEPLQRATVALLVGSAQALRGDFERSASTLDGAFGDPSLAPREPRVLIAKAAAAYFRGDLEGALAGYGRAVEVLRERGTIGELPYALALLASMEHAAGRLAVAAADIAEGLELARDTRQETDRAHLLGIQALVDAMRGDEAGCRAHAEEALKIGTARGLASANASALAALGLLELGKGRPDEALPHLVAVADAGHGLRHPMVALTTAPVLAEAAMRAGRPEIAAEALARFEPWARGTRAPWALALAARMRALLSRDGADAHFQEAIALHEDGLELARTRLLYGEHLRRTRRRVEAREHLRAALSVFEALDVAPWAARAAAELRATGLVLRRSPQRRIAELTPQELRIVRHVIDGASNPEVAARLFVSRRTVEHHLTNVFAKLGISSRTELAHALSEAPAPPSS